MRGAARFGSRHRLEAATGLCQNWPEGLSKGTCRQALLSARIDSDNAPSRGASLNGRPSPVPDGRRRFTGDWQGWRNGRNGSSPGFPAVSNPCRARRPTVGWFASLTCFIGFAPDGPVGGSLADSELAAQCATCLAHSSPPSNLFRLILRQLCPVVLCSVLAGAGTPRRVCRPGSLDVPPVLPLSNAGGVTAATLRVTQQPEQRPSKRLRPPRRDIRITADATCLTLSPR